MTLKKLLFIIAVGVLIVPVHAQQNPTEADWNHYFDALFLPENSPESESAANRVEHPQMRSMLFSTPQSKTSRARQENAPAASSSESVQSINTTALSDMDAASPALSAIQLPDAIATAEQNHDDALLKEYYKQYRSTYPLHQNVYEYARHLLNSVAMGGWLVVQGQLDTYPLRALQTTEGFRADVQIVNLNWLKNDPMYRNQIASKLSGNPGWKSEDTDQQLIQKLRKTVPGDLYLSMTVPTDLLQSFRASLQPAGLAFVLSDNSTSRERHHAILAKVDWNKVTAPALPEYVEALQQNYIAALLLDEKLGNPASLGSANRSEILPQLYEQRSLRPAGENYLQSK